MTAFRMSTRALEKKGVTGGPRENGEEDGALRRKQRMEGKIKKSKGKERGKPALNPTDEKVAMSARKRDKKTPLKYILSPTSNAIWRKTNGKRRR